MTVTTTSKAYEILVEQRTNYLYVSLKGEENTYDTAKQYWTEILNHQSKGRCSNVLIEKSFSRSLDIQDAFRVLTEVAFIARSGVRFAFVESDFDSEKKEFEELVGSNRGMKIKHFDNLASAERWLAA